MSSMKHEHDLFEKFPDGSSLWRASISGLKNARFQLQEFAQMSTNQFYGIDLIAGKILWFSGKRIGRGFDKLRKINRRGNEKKCVGTIVQPISDRCVIHLRTGLSIRTK